MDLNSLLSNSALFTESEVVPLSQIEYDDETKEPLLPQSKEER